MALVDLGLAPPRARVGRRAGAWRQLDLALAGAGLALAGLGLLVVYSASRAGLAAEGVGATAVVARQAVWLAVGLAVGAGLLAVDYRRLAPTAPVAWLGAVALLAAVLTPLGRTVNGARSWFALGPASLQPAELAKVAVLVLLASLCARVGADGALGRRRLAVALLAVGVPVGLILLQPDLGSALVYAAVAVGVLGVAGARGRDLAALALVATVGVAGAFALGVVDLEPYQRDRFTAFLQPEGTGAAPDGLGYTQAQSKIAVANGGVLGEGLFEGSQTRLGFVPEQPTDFIFTVVAEELGLVGSTTLLALYAVVAWRTWHAACVARDRFGALLCVGVLSMLAFQVFQSVGMAMGIMPVTGIPLPLLSYGGSSLVTTCAALALVLNVGMRRTVR